jgi:hypothetical protein
MRLPRWLLVVLLVASAVALIAFPAWLWIEMPRRTAAKFIRAIKWQESDAVNELLDGGKAEVVEAFNFTTGFQIAVAPANVADILRGRRTITAKYDDGFDVGVRFLATWTSVSMDPPTAQEARVAFKEAVLLRVNQKMKVMLQQLGAMPNAAAQRTDEVDH